MENPFNGSDEDGENGKGARAKSSTAPDRKVSLKRTGSRKSGGRAQTPPVDEEIGELWKNDEWKRMQKTRLEKEIDVGLLKMKAESAAQREDSFEIVSHAKDRSLTTATIAIFILEVTVLKDLLVSGSYGIFYYVTLSLIGIGLLIDVIVGFILLAIHSVKTKVRNMGPDMMDPSVAYGTFKVPKTHKLFSKDETVKDKSPLVIEEAEQPSGMWSCVACAFPCFFTDEESLEERLLRMYKACYMNELKATLDFEHMQASAGHLDRDLAAVAEAGEFFEDPAAFPQELLDDDDSLTDSKLRSMLENWHHLKSLRKQGTTLLHRATEIQRRKLIAKILQLQNCVTHLLFILCLDSIVTIAFGFLVNEYSNIANI